MRVFSEDKRAGERGIRLGRVWIRLGEGPREEEESLGVSTRFNRD